MKICAFMLLCTVQLVASEYSRFKLRGPPMPPRPPPYPQYVKKWQHVQRAPVRARPIPVHMPTAHKISMGVPTTVARPIAPPVRNFWKTTQTTFRTPPEKPYLPKVPEKTFISSPTISNKEYDYHVQSNAIPMHTNPIKQVGEKGPIHTIPAPNLSLADKPIVVEEMRQDAPHHGPATTFVQVQKAHQYQVTEVPEVHNKQYRQQHYVVQNFDTSLRQTQPLFPTPVQQKQEEIYSNGDRQQLGAAQLESAHQLSQYSSSHVSSPQIDAKELYQLLSTYPQQQQQILDAFNVPVLQSQFLQPQQTIQNLQIQQPLFQPDQNYVQQIHSQTASDKVSIQPEYHTFNYEEQDQQQNQPRKKSSLVTATYNLESTMDTSESSQNTAPRNTLDALAQAQYVQKYFDTRENNVANNNVEADAKVSEPEVSEDISEEFPEESPGFYSSLPSKQAADTLANLQAAGKINSNLMKLSQSKTPISIYVPDEDEDDKVKDANDDYQRNDQEYEDYSQEDMVSQENHPVSDTFGHRIKPKRI